MIFYSYTLIQQSFVELPTFTVLSTDPENILPRETAKQATLP